MNSRDQEHPTATPTVVCLGLPYEFLSSFAPIDDLRLVNADHDMAAAIHHCLEHAPSLLMAPAHLILSDGPKLLPQLTRRASRVQIVGVGNADKDLVADLLHSGCSGILTPNTQPPDLRRAIYAISGGELWYPRQALSSAVRTLLSTVSETRLTQREREVLRFIGQGLTNREIAGRLFISHETVRWHVRSLNSKVGARDRKRLSALASNGWAAS